MIQEGGRPARYPGALPSDNQYHVNILWLSFCSLLFRIYVIPLIEEEQKEVERKETECTSNDEAQLQPFASSPASIPVSSQGSTPALTVSPVPAMASTLLARGALLVRQYSNLLSVLQVIHLYPGCLHVKLEQACINPFVATCHQSLPCWDACFFCQKAPASKTIYRPFARFGLSALLIDVFIKNPGPIESCVLQEIHTTLSTYVKSESDLGFNQLVLSSGRKTNSSEGEAAASILR